MGLRIHFTGDDVRRVTIAQHPAPMWEIERSLRALQLPDTGAATAPWRAWARMRLPRTAHHLLTLVPPSGPCPDFLSPIGHAADLESGLEQVLSTPRSLLNRDMEQLAQRRRLPVWAQDVGRGSLPALRSLGRALRDYHQTVVRPVHRQLAADFDVVVGELTQTLSRHGLDALFAGLHPSIHWNPPVLEVGHELFDEDVYLDGWGLHLVPSFFTPTNAFCVNHQPPMTVIFPIVPREPWHPGPGPGRARAADTLAALLGGRRAALLRHIAATDGITTTRLADSAALAPSTVSHHTAALRDAGLITTHRTGTSVRHCTTPLGLNLLRAQPGGILV
ncbi:ArsR/SmtB family transcription factor [Streptomyces kanamyceticus]|uniref:Transcriptional regulator n=1 Tax=Streptomyces kanamyceticus TaxID=1967 RepID=A0A5J6G8D7_STRKN|nr:helix-turn-helix transcriptional regulator [Streptomyces kanamyceticus]QEU90882.1 transcriptional regulator [Streptomyces kanamyceticus]